MNLPQGEIIHGAKVIGCTKDPNGDSVGKYNDNSLLKYILYGVELPDDEIKEYSATIVAENMYAQVDA